MKLVYRFSTIDLRTGKVLPSSKPIVHDSRADAIDDAIRLLSFLHIAGYEITETKYSETENRFRTDITSETFRVITPEINDERLIAGSLKSHKSKVKRTLARLREEYATK